ncbi:peroxiredoxin [Saccharospirillum salsuginis]|uniref:thioredoxin-dependent peroxiredoxin n=1 Tax=Saccharospirillum salsuginis TaxID=418750 RepID=A0A918KGQ7_9GAMM|nr:peroxiredoxin [Saccharospirillum salsuginis]GGX62293.1 peroxiredoxin [Saccharospirillum salsuginis]
MALQPGQPVPDFVVPATSHKNVHLRALKGYQVLLYFYPKNHTPACTIETQDFGANYQRFRDRNILVFGVSRDTLDSHERFKREQSLPFELISDHNEALCRIFGVLREKELFGRRIYSLVRSTFLIDETGCLTSAWRDVDARSHVHRILEELERGGTRKTG